jgi:hypothetical protein
MLLPVLSRFQSHLIEWRPLYNKNVIDISVKIQLVLSLPKESAKQTDLNSPFMFRHNLIRDF